MKTGSSRDALCYFANARAKYRPSSVRYLLIAEAPPIMDSGRFFYFEEVAEKDHLFWETMKVLYPGQMPAAGYPRGQKREFLHRFQCDGFYLLDAVEEPFGDISVSVKRRRIRDSLPRLIDDLHRLCERTTKIILISAPVYAVCIAPLKASGFELINEEMIDFPGSGGQKKFRVKMTRVLHGAGWSPG